MELIFLLLGIPLSTFYLGKKLKVEIKKILVKYSVIYFSIFTIFYFLDISFSNFNLDLFSCVLAYFSFSVITIISQKILKEGILKALLIMFNIFYYFIVLFMSTIGILGFLFIFSDLEVDNQEELNKSYIIKEYNLGNMTSASWTRLAVSKLYVFGIFEKEIYNKKFRAYTSIHWRTENNTLIISDSRKDLEIINIEE